MHWQIPSPTFLFLLWMQVLPFLGHLEEIIIFILPHCNVYENHQHL